MCDHRIGELREEMDEIGRKQCDYDPVSGETYDFDGYAMTHTVYQSQLLHYSG